MEKCLSSQSSDPFSAFPYLPQLEEDTNCSLIPDEHCCYALWNKYGMLENVRKHSLMVAHVAYALAEKAKKLGYDVDVASVKASALLHDLSKTYCLKHGGSHAMLGAAWVVHDTKNFKIAQGVLLHVHWPWNLPSGKNICILPIFVLYADKRVRHDKCVNIRERFDDLLVRYGKTEAARDGIKKSYEQTLLIERLLSQQLECDLNENYFDSGRLVN